MSRTIPHAVPLSRFRTVTDVKHQIEVMRHPRPEARQAGCDAFHANQTRSSNPHPVLSPEHAEWDNGYAYEIEANS